MEFLKPFIKWTMLNCKYFFEIFQTAFCSRLFSYSTWLHHCMKKKMFKIHISFGICFKNATQLSPSVICLADDTKRQRFSLPNIKIRVVKSKHWVDLISACASWKVIKFKLNYFSSFLIIAEKVFRTTLFHRFATTMNFFTVHQLPHSFLN